MCAAIDSRLLILRVFILPILISSISSPTVEGLPLPGRRDRDIGDDLIAGRDFLSIFMSSSAGMRRYYSRTTTTTTTEEPTTTENPAPSLALTTTTPTIVANVGLAGLSSTTTVVEEDLMAARRTKADSAVNSLIRETRSTGHFSYPRLREPLVRVTTAPTTRRILKQERGLVPSSSSTSFSSLTSETSPSTLAEFYPSSNVYRLHHGDSYFSSNLNPSGSNPIGESNSPLPPNIASGASVLHSNPNPNPNPNPDPLPTPEAHGALITNLVSTPVPDSYPTSFSDSTSPSPTLRQSLSPKVVSGSKDSRRKVPSRRLSNSASRLRNSPSAVHSDNKASNSGRNKYEPVIENSSKDRSEQEPHVILSGASKSEFSVDEGEPITTNHHQHQHQHHQQPSGEYPANIRQLPGITTQGLLDVKTKDLIAQHLSREQIKTPLQPYHETVVYHPREQNSRARSVSYSTVIQSIPSAPEKVWNVAQKSYEELNKYQDGQYQPEPENEYQEANKYQKSDKFEEKYQDGSKYREGNEYQDGKYQEDKYQEGKYQEDKYQEGKYQEGKYQEGKYQEGKYQEGKYEEAGFRNNGTESTKGSLVYGRPEENYEVDEAVSVMTNGRTHGVQQQQQQQQQQQSEQEGKDKKSEEEGKQKVGYVVEGRNYRKYRVEERTSDGFIVGEYGVVSHDDGSLRGVRYTADGATNPRLIYDALMKFLSL